MLEVESRAKVLVETKLADATLDVAVDVAVDAEAVPPVEDVP